MPKSKEVGKILRMIGLERRRAHHGFSLGGGDDDHPVAEINITPMVDIMLVLLIIFMVTAPLMKQGVDVNLPQAASTPVNTEDDRLSSP